MILVDLFTNVKGYRDFEQGVTGLENVIKATILKLYDLGL